MIFCTTQLGLNPETYLDEVCDSQTQNQFVCEQEAPGNIQVFDFKK